MPSHSRDERGAGLLMAVVLAAILMTIGAMMTRLGWDAAASGHEGYVRVQASAAAASAAAAELAVVREALITEMSQNILDQGCRQQSTTGIMDCLIVGNDVARTSGIRRDRIQTLASRSTASWSELQTAFAEVFRQVSPLGVSWDAYRSPSMLGYGGAMLEGQLEAGTLSAPWRGYVMVTPIEGRAISFDAAQRRAIVPFEIRAYGWSYVESRTGRRVTAQVTAWSTSAMVELTYPACPSYWQPDAICQYPETVNVQIPPASWLHNDPAVRWAF